ncbi:MAG: Fe-S cluster assembly protein SufD [Acidimicrobiales bacterium]
MAAEARQRVATIERPTKRDEAWRYAPHAKLAQLTFGAPTAPPPVPNDVERQIPVVDGPTIVIVNGVVDPTRSRLDGLAPGLDVSSLAEVAARAPEWLDAHFTTVIDDAFAAANIAFGTDGAVITVADDHQLVSPLHVVDISLPGETPNTSCTGVVIHLGASSSATVVETRIGGSGTGATASTITGGSNTRTSITLGPNATLEHIVLQDLPRSQIQLGAVVVSQAEGSGFLGRSFNIGAGYGRLAYRVELVGEGAQLELSGLFFGRGEQVLDQQIDVIHAAKDCASTQSFRGVLDDDSVGVFNGGIDVRPGADGTDAAQSNSNLVLSNRAEINTQPRLEILADDVACKHGATVGQLDETALYYLRSRGIPAPEARRLLIDAFADQTLESVSIESIRGWVIQRLGHTDG